MDPNSNEVTLDAGNGQFLYIMSLDRYPTSIEVIEKEEYINVYPNPSKGRIYIELLNENFKPTRLSLLTITGEVLIDIPFTEELDIQNLSAGTYLLLLGDKNEMVSSSIVLIR